MSLFEVLDGDATSNVIVHVPHAGLIFPGEERSSFLLTDRAREVEALLMADTATDTLARITQELSAVKPWVFINRLSRLVVDPERFTDETEEMNSVGMGFAYERTSDRQPLRALTDSARGRLLETYFDPYTRRLSELVKGVLANCGTVVIVDLHSFAVDALGYELHKEAERPAVCIGTDPFHTSTELTQLAVDSFGKLGSTALNEPFAGTYVPLFAYGKDPRVQSVMLEIRKDTYGFGDETSDAFAGTVKAIAGFVGRLALSAERLL